MIYRAPHVALPSPSVHAAARLPPAIKASVLAMQSARSAADIETLDIIRALLQLGAKQRTITDLTGFPARTVRAWFDRDSPNASVGRPVSSLRIIVRSPLPHLALGYAARAYHSLVATGLYPPPQDDGLCPRAFVRAMIATHSVYAPEHVAPEHLLLALHAIRDGMVALHTCRRCPSAWLAAGGRAHDDPSAEYLVDAECPSCRTFARLQQAKRLPDASCPTAVRDLLAKLPSTGTGKRPAKRARRAASGTAKASGDEDATSG